MNRLYSCGFGIDEAKSAQSIDDLINIMKTPKGVEHCMKFQFPDMNILLQNERHLMENNVFVDGHHTIENPSLVLAFGGTVSILVDNYNVCEVYATNDAIVKLIAKDNAFVTVEVYHESTVVETQNDKSRIRIFKK
ncbi:hypothetical protein [Sphingobacterium corticis]